MLMRAGDTPSRMGGSRVSAAIFPLIGAQPILGRGLQEEDEQEGNDNVVVISSSLWQQQQLSGRGDVIGATSWFSTSGRTRSSASCRRASSSRRDQAARLDTARAGRHAAHVPLALLCPPARRCAAGRSARGDCLDLRCGSLDDPVESPPALKRCRRRTC